MSMWGDIPQHRLVSPREIYTQAVNVMLGGKDPVSHDDYALVMNYIAANLLPDTALNACLLMGVIFDMPLSKQDITDIVQFQLKDNN
jgi:hypothetical protein